MWLENAKQDPDGFLAALAAATIPVGGWIVYGAMRLLWNFNLLDSNPPRPDADAIRLAALQFIHDSGYGWERVTFDDQAFWRRAVGEW